MVHAAWNKFQVVGLVQRQSDLLVLDKVKNFEEKYNTRISQYFPYFPITLCASILRTETFGKKKFWKKTPWINRMARERSLRKKLTSKLFWQLQKRRKALKFSRL
jgi:hypothetical protein